MYNYTEIWCNKVLHVGQVPVQYIGFDIYYMGGILLQSKIHISNHIMINDQSNMISKIVLSFVLHWKFVYLLPRHLC